jgi:hypothetical protein
MVWWVSRRAQRIVIAVLAVIALVAVFVIPRMSTPTPESITPVVVASTATPPTSSTTSRSTASSDATLARLFATKQSNVAVQGSGTVQRLLADDTSGDQHQRFILQLASGQTLLVAHNIDIAPRLNGLQTGDTVAFFGEYVYTDQGGTIHWTHHDPSGTHVAGWLEWNGRRYQ